MEITSLASKERTLEDYDVTFIGGHMMTISVCKDEGDTVDFDTYPHAVRFHLSAKKALSTDDNLDLPPEDITLYTAHILAIQHRARVIPPLTAEQKAMWERTVKSLSKTIQ